MERNLTTEVYLQIFKSLSEKDLRHNISLVSKKWFKLVQDFNLVPSRLWLTSPFDHNIKRLFRDPKYRTFARKVKYIYIRDDCKDVEDDDVLMSGLDYNVDRFESLIRSCPNLEELTIWLEGLSLFSNLFTQIAFSERLFETNLKVLKVDFNDLNKSRNKMWFNDFMEIDLMQIFNETLPSLQELLFYSTSNKFEEDRLAFFHTGQFPSDDCPIRKIKIDCPNSIMSKPALEFIISGQLPNLEELELHLTIDRIFPDSGPAVRKNDSIFNRLRNFCSTSLKHYNSSSTSMVLIYSQLTTVQIVAIDMS